MKNPIKKVIAVHDLSGMGRCSLSVIIPTLSVMGIQVCPLPTAILSTQTDGFSDFTFRDLTGDLVPYFEHLLAQGGDFQAFYSGFLGNAKQIEKVEYMIDKLPSSTLVLVDPVMGDDGEFYSTYNHTMKDGMKELIKKAGVITPNVTEAAFLLDCEPKSTYTKEEICQMIKNLANITSAKIVITGIEGDGSVNCAYSEDGGKTIGFTSNKRVGKRYPGTGDVFASVLLGRLLQGKSFALSVEKASAFVGEVMAYSTNFLYPEREGVLIENNLSKLLDE